MFYVTMNILNSAEYNKRNIETVIIKRNRRELKWKIQHHL